MAEDPGIDVSIVLPVHNERDHLAQEVARIRSAMDASTYSYELIVVDDGSTDGSGDVARELGGLRLLRLEDNRGSGAARRAGSRAARGEVVVWTDVDMTYPNDTIPWLVEQLGDHDQVVGARTTEEGTHKFLRVPAKYLIRRLASYLVERRIPDLNSGFRAFRRDVGDPFLDDLPDGFSCVTTLTMSFLTNGYSVHYVDIPYAERAGRSKFHWWTDTRRYLRQVVRMAMSYNPLRVFMPAGLLLLVLATAKLLYDWVTRDFSLSPNTLLIFLAAFQVVTTGLLADLVARGQRRDRLLPSSRIHHEELATEVTTDPAAHDRAHDIVPAEVGADDRPG